MSLADAQQFIVKVAKDKVLQKALQDAVHAEIVAAGAVADCFFTVAELEKTSQSSGTINSVWHKETLPEPEPNPETK